MDIFCTHDPPPTAERYNPQNRALWLQRSVKWTIKYQGADVTFKITTLKIQQA